MLHSPDQALPLARALLAGGIDVMVEVPPASLSEFQGEGYEIYEAAGPHLWFLILNLKEGPFMDVRIRQDADSGRPTVVSDPDGALAQTYMQIARRIAVRIAGQTKDMSLKFPTIKVQNT